MELSSETAPLAMRANVEHNQILHEHVLILGIETVPVPHVPDAERLDIDDLGYKDDRIIHVTARFGYMDEPNVPGLLPLIANPTSKAPWTTPSCPTSCRPSSCAGALRPA